MIGIMAHHPPMTAVISDGEVQFTLPDGTRKTCIVSRGMFDISKNDARLLCDSALEPEKKEEALRQRELYEAQLEEEEKKARRDFMTTQLSFAKALNALKQKNRNEMHKAP